MSIELKGKYVGAMVGSALGDAIGELAFRCPEQEPLKALVSRTAELVYTDDTAMAIGLAESLLEKRGIDQQHLGETFNRNFFREPWRGYASGPPAIFSRVRSQGMSYVEAAKALFDGWGSFGNGAAMRIGPVGLFFHRSNNLYDEACASAEVTHAHPVGKDGAAIVNGFAENVYTEELMKKPLCRIVLVAGLPSYVAESPRIIGIDGVEEGVPESGPEHADPP